MSYQKDQIVVQRNYFKDIEGCKETGSDFVLKDFSDNFVSKDLCDSVLRYFCENKIGWWKGRVPTTLTLSSQIACINHLFPICTDREAVLAVARTIDPDIDDVEKLENDSVPQYISFEVVSDTDHLNERKHKGSELTRGSNCTSVDAVILAKKNGKHILLAIEWKYIEHYGNEDKSKNQKDKTSGDTRLTRYTGSEGVHNKDLIPSSKQLVHLPDYRGTVYFFEPFYQLMRQTLWAEQMVKFRSSEKIKADDYINVHVIPTGNDKLRGCYQCSGGKDLYTTWVEHLQDPSKYVLTSPDVLLSVLPSKYEMLVSSLAARYWK